MEYKKERFIRWQSSLPGYWQNVINLLVTLSLASLGFLFARYDSFCYECELADQLFIGKSYNGCSA